MTTNVLVVAALLSTLLLAAISATTLEVQGQAPPPGSNDKPTGDLAPTAQAEADELAEATIKSVCMTCHPFENIVRLRRTAKDWNTVVTRMATNGARATDEQFRMVRRYFIRYYGVIGVNSATADEFSAVLGYAPKDAAAIVAFRQTNGPFADVAALAKVPGLDRAKLDEQPEALLFDR